MLLYCCIARTLAFTTSCQHNAGSVGGLHSALDSFATGSSFVTLELWSSQKCRSTKPALLSTLLLLAIGNAFTGREPAGVTILQHLTELAPDIVEAAASP